MAMTTAQFLAFLVSLARAPLAHAFYGGGSPKKCEEKCMAADDQCPPHTDACSTSQTCHFTCTCIDKCAAAHDEMTFNECSDDLAACFANSSAIGYEHLKCWDRLCSEYYAQVEEEREEGEWEGLGGWEVFHSRVPIAAMGASSTLGVRFVAAAAIVGTLMLVAVRAMSGRRSSDSSQHLEMLSAIESGSEEVE